MERGERTSERASERASGWTYAASATVAAGATSRQTSFTHNQTGTHTRKHAILLCVCVEVGVALAACARSLSPLLSFSLSHLPEFVIELEPYSSLLDLLFRYLCVCTMRVCVYVRVCACLSVLVSLS